MKKILIITPSHPPGGIFRAVKEKGADSVFLIVPEGRENEAVHLKEEFSKFKIKTEKASVSGRNMGEIFEIVYRVSGRKNTEAVLSVSDPDRKLSNILLSAAFVNGIPALEVDEDEVSEMPVLNFSYHRLLSHKKKEIIETLSKMDGASSLNELAQEIDASLPLMSYHINGNYKSPGLRELGIVDAKEEGGKLKLSLTRLGNLMLKGI